MSQIGLILALGCALISGVALLCKHRGACDAPDVAMRSPLRSAGALFRSPWWAIGFALATLAWALHVAALSMAPLSRDRNWNARPRRTRTVRGRTRLPGRDGWTRARGRWLYRLDHARLRGR